MTSRIHSWTKVKDSDKGVVWKCGRCGSAVLFPSRIPGHLTGCTYSSMGAVVSDPSSGTGIDRVSELSSLLPDCDFAAVQAVMES